MVLRTKKLKAEIYKLLINKNFGWIGELSELEKLHKIFIDIL